MRREQTTQTLRLRLLALVLALAIVWYSLNPVPTSIIRRKRDDELPDEKKRSIEPQDMPETLPVAFKRSMEMIEPFLTTEEDDDDFEWPEFIDG
jgi:hypothetical protein